MGDTSLVKQPNHLPGFSIQPPGTCSHRQSVTVHTVHMAGAGKATGKIYDCNAGFDNWLQGAWTSPPGVASTIRRRKHRGE